jgi:hypothetical protein
MAIDSSIASAWWAARRSENPYAPLAVSLCRGQSDKPMKIAVARVEIIRMRLNVLPSWFSRVASGLLAELGVLGLAECL